MSAGPAGISPKHHYEGDAPPVAFSRVGRGLVLRDFADAKLASSELVDQYRATLVLGVEAKTDGVAPPRGFGCDK